METSRLKELADELDEMKIFAVGLAGGEPILHPDFLHIVDYLLEKNFYVEVLSNGVLLNKVVIGLWEIILKKSRFLLVLNF